MMTLAAVLLLSALAPARAGEAERAWAAASALPASLELGARFPGWSAPPLSIPVPKDDRTPPPLIQPGKPACFLRPGPAPGAEPLLRLDLGALHNRLWRTRLTVAFGGRTYHLSAMESRQGHYFMVVHDPEGKTFFLRETDLALGGADLPVPGGRLHVWIAPDALDLWGSRVCFKAKGAGGLPCFPVREVMRAMYEAGEPASLEGRGVRVHYTDQAFEDASGRVVRAGEPLLVLMVEQARWRSEKSRYQGDAIETLSLPSSADGALLVGHFRIPPFGLFAGAFRTAEEGRLLEVFPPPAP